LLALNFSIQRRGRSPQRSTEAQALLSLILLPSAAETKALVGTVGRQLAAGLPRTRSDVELQ
jgi:hypothetical protein